jgi:hypothetical protein
MGAMGIASRGSGWRDGGRRGAHGGGARPWSFGKGTHAQKGKEEGENRPARTLTPQWNSSGGSRR